MPSLRELGDSNAVENKYVDRVVFYVEGEDDSKLFKVYLLKPFLPSVEIKIPSTLGGGYQAVMRRVQDERTVNKKIFGIVDGEALLPLGHVAAYRDLFGASDWIVIPEFEGIYFIPCWELENLLYSRDILPPGLIALQPVARLTQWTERTVKNVILAEALRLSELSSLNLALMAESYGVIRAETKSEIDKRHDLLREIEAEVARLERSDPVKRRYEEWREFFRNLLRTSPTRDHMYDEFVSRVDGKALSIRLRRRLRILNRLLSVVRSRADKIIELSRAALPWCRAMGKVTAGWEPIRPKRCSLLVSLEPTAL